MKIKVNKLYHPLSRFSVRKSNSVTRGLLALRTFPPHGVSPRQETTASKIAIAFLFGQFHFNDVTSHALFYGGHLVMRSAKPGNHLN